MGGGGAFATQKTTKVLKEVMSDQGNGAQANEQAKKAKIAQMNPQKQG